MDDNNLNKFFNWLTEPMKQDEVDAWYRANNITPELNILFKDFCFSLYYSSFFGAVEILNGR